MQRSLPSVSRPQLRNLLSRLRRGVYRRISIDVRALAAFRIALGTLVLVDLLRRSRNLVAFYTDAGVLPREALFADYSNVYSLHTLSGEAWVQALLFLVAGAFALAMAVGYRTRLATVVSWLLLLSLHTRNPMVLNGGDVLLRLLLFWGIFLPLGERWSLDARRLNRDRSTVTAVATLAVLVQMVLLYATNAGHKTSGDQWLNGEAIIYVFSLDQFTIFLGNVLADYYLLLRALTYLWIALVVLCPLLLLLTGRLRTVLVSLFAGMHIGMLLTMRLDLFPLIVIVGLLLFYPPAVWDGVARVASRIGLSAIAQRWSARVDAVRPRSLLSPLPSPPLPGRRHVRTLGTTVVPLAFLVLVLFSNAQAVGLAEVPEPAEPVLELTETDQHWQLFAPDPLSTDGWYVVPGHLANGSAVDVLHRSAVDWDRPPNIEDAYPTARWRKYLGNVWSSANWNHREYLANYLCTRWNRHHETAVTNVTLYYMAQPSQPFNESEPIRENTLGEYDCAAEIGQ